MNESVTLYRLTHDGQERLVALDDRFEPSVRHVKRWFPARTCMMTGHDYPAGDYTTERTAMPVKDIFTGEKFLIYADDENLKHMGSWCQDELIEENDNER